MSRTLISWSSWRDPVGRDIDPDRGGIVVAQPWQVCAYARASRLGQLPRAIRGGSPNGYQNLLINQGPAQVDGPTLTAAAEASILPTAANGFAYAGLLNVMGKTLQFTLAGRFSTAATPGTGQLRCRLGTAAGTAGTVLFDTGAMTLSTSATTLTWTAKAILTVRAIGSGTSANAMVIGEVANFTGTVGTGVRNMIPASAPAVTAGYDSTIAPFFNWTWTPSLATASFTLHQIVVEEMN